MLSYQQVLPFLDHPDAWIVFHAAEFLSDLRPLPATAAEHVWRAIDRHGPSYRLFELLKHVRPDDFWLSRALERTAGSSDENVHHWLATAMAELDFEFLRARADAVLDHESLDPALRQHLRERLSLADVGFENLWDDLLSAAAAREQEENDDAGQSTRERSLLDELWPDRLIEALARHPQAAGERAMTILTDESVQDWREIYAVQLAGALRYEPAIDVLVRKVAIDADLLNEEAARSLYGIGTLEVVRKVDSCFTAQPWGARLYLSDVLSHIFLDQSEATLQRLLETERNLMVRTDLAMALAHQCSASAVEPLRKMVHLREYDEQMVDLGHEFLNMCTILGLDLPEMHTIRKRVKQREQSFRRRMEKLEKAFGKSLPGTDYRDFEPDPYAPVAPIQRDPDKVGRNEPCPCGSGKKYKKCCLGKATL